jgi:hypothetical protein
MIEKPKPPRVGTGDRIIHVRYTEEYLSYVGYTLAQEEKGEPAESYRDWCDRRAGMSVLTDEELMRRINEREPK